MPTARKLIAGLALTLTAVACSDKTTDVTPPADPQATTEAPTAPRAKQALIFEGAQTFNDVAYTNTVQVTKFNYSRSGQLTVDGRIIWKDATGAVVNTQDFM